MNETVDLRTITAFKGYQEKDGHTAALLGYALSMIESEVKEYLELRGFRHPGTISKRVLEDLDLWSATMKSNSWLTDEEKEIIISGYETVLPPEDRFEFHLKSLRSGGWRNDKIFSLSLFLLHQIILTGQWVDPQKKPHDPITISSNKSHLFTMLFKLIFSRPSGQAPEGLEDDYRDKDFNPVICLVERGLVYTRRTWKSGKTDTYYIIIPPHLASLFTNQDVFNSYFPKEIYSKLFGNSEAIKQNP